jgi:hypothetical protein
MKKLLVSLALVVAACSPGSNAEDTGVSAGALAAPEWDSPDCEEPHGPVARPESTQDLEQRFEGAWALCSGRLRSAAPGDVAGLAFSGGRMHYLVRGRGGLVRGGRSTPVEWDAWRMGHFNNQVVLDFELPEERGRYTYRIAASGAFLELDSLDVSEVKRARFVRATPHRPEGEEAVAAPTPAPSAAPPSPSSPPCPTIEERKKLLVPDEFEMKKKLAGRWRVCSGSLPGRSDVRGIEFLLDDLDRSNPAHHLIEREGALVRGSGWDYDYDVVVFDTKLFNGPGVYQLSIARGAGGYGGIARMSPDADVLQIRQIGDREDVTLVRVPAP